MVKNLKEDVMISGEESPSNDSFIEKYCYDNDTENCKKYGGLYTWVEAMNTPDSCNYDTCYDLYDFNAVQKQIHK